jgi:CBS domain containing-hemolysin-like protein
MILRMLVATLPAIGAALFFAASAAINALSSARRAALRDAMEGATRAALDRYIAGGTAIESRWLVLRVFGIAFSAVLFGRELPASWGAWVPLLSALFALAAYGVPTEILRVLVQRNPELSAPFLLRVLQPLELLASPIAAPLVWIGRLVAGPTDPQRSTATAGVTETEVEIIVNEGELNGSLDHEQSEMIRNVLDFGDVSAGEVMVPRTHVTAFDAETSVDELLRRVAESKHSRYPIYRERIDNVVGVLHVKDLINYAASHELRDLELDRILRKPVVFVPESQPASTVLRDMRVGRHHLAVVIDEFGGMAGIVTLEDLIEEIVGDIRDEHDVEEPPIVDLGNGRIIVDASISIADLSRYLGADLPEDGNYNSLGGFIVDRLGRVPRVGAKLAAFGLEFVVREADQRHVSKVEIVRTAPSPESISPRSSTRMTAA